MFETDSAPVLYKPYIPILEIFRARPFFSTDAQVRNKMGAFLTLHPAVVWPPFAWCIFVRKYRLFALSSIFQVFACTGISRRAKQQKPALINFRDHFD